ncbi:MAG: beta-galactosidase [Propionibacteriaceae bacterium]|jgi:beta-galactosidase|nr:beta-galactosidase [Propionibacteriaceae bacterium]
MDRLGPPALASIAYGGDYNPEQWPEAYWDEDYRAFDQARINTLTVNVFSWADLEPAPGQYDFTRLDRIIDRLEAEGRQMVLATPTGAIPPWMALDHPEVCRVDFEGRQHRFGQRHNACPSSTVYRDAARSIATALAGRYHRRRSLIAWHICNEYGGDGGACYCDHCAAGFRSWLRQHYGDLDLVNQAWNSSFWSHRFTSWEQIMAPSALTEHWRGPDYTAFQGMTLDYRRYMSDCFVELFVNEKTAIAQIDPVTPCTTNLMGFFRPIDYWRLAPHLDFVSWDNYPPDMHSQVRMAATHDLMRGLGDGQPFWVMEQTPSRTASRDVNPLKPPGVMRLWSWQAIAHGAQASLFFQMRASRGACEKYHGAVIDHTGSTDSRTFQEVAAHGVELDGLGEALIGGSTPAPAALIFDWDCWWSLEMTDGLNRHLKYLDVVLSYYRAFHQLGIGIDFVPMTANLDRYDLVLAPAMHMVKGDIIERLNAVAARGGTVVTGAMSGLVDESTRAILDPMGSALGGLAGIRLEESDQTEPDDEIDLVLNGSDWQLGRAQLVHDIISCQVGTEAWAFYADRERFFNGRPAITHRQVGSRGQVVYIGSLLTNDLMSQLARFIWTDEPHPVMMSVNLAQRAALERQNSDFTWVDPEVEVANRLIGGRLWEFVLNHQTEPISVVMRQDCQDRLSGQALRADDRLLIPAKGVALLDMGLMEPGLAAD